MKKKHPKDNKFHKGKKNGFEIQKILLVNHGAQHNDTICTLETKATSEPVPQES